MKNICVTYVVDGKLRTAVRTIEDSSLDEILHLIDRLAVT